jgi:uncharacterized membrane protein
MSRQAFMATLRAGLRGLPPATVDEIAADYDSHFSEGLSAGRTEAQVAAALGDPKRLARELKAEAGLKRWEAERNPSSAMAALAAVLGLATIDILILLPLLMGLGGILFGLFMAAIGMSFGGLWLAVMSGAGHKFGPTIDGATMVLIGLGVTSLGVALGALLIPVVAGIIHLLVRYGRLHYRLLQPALEPRREEAGS